MTDVCLEIAHCGVVFALGSLELWMECAPDPPGQTLLLYGSMTLGCSNSHFTPESPVLISSVFARLGWKHDQYLFYQTLDNVQEGMLSKSVDFWVHKTMLIQCRYILAMGWGCRRWRWTTWLQSSRSSALWKTLPAAYTHTTSCALAAWLAGPADASLNKVQRESFLSHRQKWQPLQVSEN